MHIAIDTTPLSNAHGLRGTGSYTRNLIDALQKYEKEYTYSFFTRGEKVPKDADLVHYPYFDPFFLTLPLSKPKPTVVTVHDLIPLVFPNKFPRGIKGELKWKVQRWSLAGVARIITDSEQSKQDIERIVGFPAEKIDVVYLAPAESFRKMDEKDKRDKKERERVKKKYRLPEKFILYVGDVNWNKNVLGMLKAFRNIKYQISNIKLVLVGKAFLDGALSEVGEIQKVIHSLKLTRDVITPGFVPEKDLVTIYNLASVYVQPSFYEGFGLPVLEAMASGCPVVCSYIASLKEIGGPAISINANDNNNIASGIEKAFSLSPQERLTLIRDQRDWAHRFRWKKVAQETVAAYEKVLANQ